MLIRLFPLHPPPFIYLLAFVIQPSSTNDIYWATGDGGPQEDPLGNGQATNNNLLAAIIRITVPSTGTGYTVPSGNFGELRCCLPACRCFAGCRPWLFGL